MSALGSQLSGHLNFCVRCTPQREGETEQAAKAAQQQETENPNGACRDTGSLLIPNKAPTWWSTLGEGWSSRQNNATDRIRLGAVVKRTKHQKYPGSHFDGILSCRPEVLRSLRHIISPLGRERRSGIRRRRHCLKKTRRVAINPINTGTVFEEKGTRGFAIPVCDNLRSAMRWVRGLHST